MCDGELYELTWRDVADAAEEDPEIWYGEAEVQWIELAWEKLAKVGATSYVTGMERTQTIIRFLSLLEIYRDFRCLVRQECRGPDYYEWAECLEISPFRVGQLIGLASHLDEVDIFAFSEALEELAHRDRENLVKTLIRAFKGRFPLFISLWETGVVSEVENYDSGNLMIARQAALRWVMQNCPSNVT